MPIAEVHIPVKLDRERTMIFNLNTLSRFQETSGLFYFDFITNLQTTFNDVVENARRAALAKNPGADLRTILFNMNDVLKHIDLRAIHHLVAAAVHEYDSDDNPVWPLTVGKVGRYISTIDVYPLVRKILDGHMQNAPTPTELGEASPRPAAKPGVAGETQNGSNGNGGVPSLELVAADFT